MSIETDRVRGRSAGLKIFFQTYFVQVIEANFMIL